MSAPTYVPTNALVAAFPQAGRAQISIRTAEVRARKAARPAAAPVPVLFHAAPRPLARPVIPAGFLTAKANVEFTAKWERPLVVAGKFDRAAIMKAAAAAAKEHQAREGGTWAAAMSVCLRAAWTVAKIAMHRATTSY